MESGPIYKQILVGNFNMYSYTIPACSKPRNTTNSVDRSSRLEVFLKILQKFTEKNLWPATLLKSNSSAGVFL